MLCGTEYRRNMVKMKTLKHTHCCSKHQCEFRCKLLIELSTKHVMPFNMPLTFYLDQEKKNFSLSSFVCIWHHSVMLLLLISFFFSSVLLAKFYTLFETKVHEARYLSKFCFDFTRILQFVEYFFQCQQFALCANPYTHTEYLLYDFYFVRSALWSLCLFQFYCIFNVLLQPRFWIVPLFFISPEYHFTRQLETNAIGFVTNTLMRKKKREKRDFTVISIALDFDQSEREVKNGRRVVIFFFIHFSG